VRSGPLAWLLAAAVLIGCSDRGAAPAAGDASRPAAGESAAEPASARSTRRPLPAFEGVTLEGERVSAASLLGRRALLFLFNPEVPDAELAAEVVSGLTRLQRSENFAIVGIAAGSDRETVERFVQEHAIPYPVIDDPSGSIARKLGVPVPVALIAADAEGEILFGLGRFPDDVPEPARAIDSYVRTGLRLPDAPAAVETGLGERPRAPDFEAEPISGGERVTLSSFRGRPVILMFFLHTCPHCHHELEFLKAELAKIPEDARPVLLGVSVMDRPASVEATLEEDGLDFFPVLSDRDNGIRTKYGVFGGVPDTFLIDADGRVAARVRGWGQPQDEPLMRMRLAKLSGQPVPMLLSSKGYSGNEFCGVCHEVPAETWTLTAHAGAFQTLVRHGAAQDPECVGCHVVGFGEPGGYTIEPPTPRLEDVGCEDCHGRGGPHQSPDFVQGDDFRPVCGTCHTEKHSLAFDYDASLPEVACSAIAPLANLPAEDKRKLVAAHGTLREPVLGTANARYVGSEACRSCHAAEYATWAEGAHARAMSSLEEGGKSRDPACLRCHTTGYGKPGGFPTGGDVSEHPGLAAVGCEDCHGPGSAHVPEDAPKRGTIVSLGDKCESCAILQVCGGCHDEANDPGFRFEVEEKIEAQRHGTIEAGTGRPKAPPSAAWRRLVPREAALDGPHAGPAAFLGAIEQAFRRSDGGPRS